MLRTANKGSTTTHILYPCLQLASVIRHLESDERLVALADHSLRRAQIAGAPAVS